MRESERKGENTKNKELHYLSLTSNQSVPIPSHPQNVFLHTYLHVFCADIRDADADDDVGWILIHRELRGQHSPKTPNAKEKVNPGYSKQLFPGNNINIQDLYWQNKSEKKRKTDWRKENER